MQAAAGGIYRVRLRLSEAERLHPAWLVGAIGATYPRADVVSISRPAADTADVTLRVRQSTAIEAGDAVVPLTEGLPGDFPTPSAVVEDVSPVFSGGSAEGGTLVAPVRGIDLLKLALAAAMIGAVAYVSYRVKDKPGEYTRAA